MVASYKRMLIPLFSSTLAKTLELINCNVSENHAFGNGTLNTLVMALTHSSSDCSMTDMGVKLTSSTFYRNRMDDGLGLFSVRGGISLLMEGCTVDGTNTELPTSNK